MAVPQDVEPNAPALRRPATTTSKLPMGRRVVATSHMEMSAYLEIASGAGVEAHGAQRQVNEGIAVIDFGSQYSHLIARRVRELKVYSEIASPQDPWEKIERINPKGVILSGGPASVYEDGAPLIPSWVFERRLPVLGICYGMQALVHQLGGSVARGAKQEFGHATLNQDSPSAGWGLPGGRPPLFHELPPSFQVWMSHGDRVEELPQGFSSLAFTENSPVAAIGNGLDMFGLQFHPEVNHTPLGTDILNNFLFRICGCGGRGLQATWPPTPSPASGSRSGRAASSARSRAASTRRSRRPCCTAPSVNSSPASSSTTACCAWRKPSGCRPPSSAAWG